MCVIDHSSNTDILKYIDMYTPGNVHIAVMYVKKRSGNWNILRFINAYILGSVHIAVMYVIKPSVIEEI
jgi:hypothetical protein